MAHVSVVRRSMSFEQWVTAVFTQIEKLIVKDSQPTGGWKVREGRYDPDGYEWLGEPRPIEEDERWGGPDVTAEFTGRVRIPEVFAGETVHFHMLTATEVMVSSGGVYLDGLDPNRQWFELCRAAQPGRSFDIRMEAYTRSRPDDDRNPRSAALRGCVQRFTSPRLVVIDPEALSLHHDLEVLRLAAFGSLSEDVTNYLQSKIRDLLKIFPAYGCPPDELRESIPELTRFIQSRIYDDNPPYTKEGKLACVAHSHLDIAYFWRARQTVQKNARTCLIQLRLMDRYPEFMYAHSQAWAYETLEKYYPDLFSEVHRRIAEGRWEIVGGLYIEPDCNVISGESLVRQILYGKLYFLEKFGIEVDNCWLPDVFGNSAIMPQILRLGGIDYFVSNKMSTWNDTNRFPHNNFVWRGIDGSEVFACVPPVHFITWMDPNQAVENWSAMQDKEVFDESLQMYGYGDGGSGVTDEMIEHYHRQERLPGIPRQRLTTGKRYLHETFSADREIPVWDGDLYLEMHRGTFTSKAELKRRNRRGEFDLYRAEALATLTAISAGLPYPVNDLRAAWKLLLVNQFHDILPGSHVGPVTKDALAEYRGMDAKLYDLTAASIEALTVTDAASSAVFNPCSWERGGPAYSGNEIAGSESQPIARADGSVEYAVEIGPVAGLSIGKVVPGAGESVEAGPGRLENRFFRLDFDNTGNLLQVFDKVRSRNVAPERDLLNQWRLYEDRPGRYNAWDIVERYRDAPVDIGGWHSAEVVESGPVTAAMRISRTFSKSRAVQVIRVFTTEPRIDFETYVEWAETERLLKVSFPLEIKARHFTTDLSSGALELPNHRNTSWEQAHFESLCHKWVDLSEGNFGVSVMNDCKYGCDVLDNVVSLSLLRAPTRPDPRSDRGTHRFTYSLFLHDGQWQRSGLNRQSYHLNMPLRIIEHRAPRFGSPVTVRGAGVMVQSLKCAEDGSGDVVLRLLETSGSHTVAEVSCESATAAHICDLLERAQGKLDSDDSAVRLPMRPFEITSIRLSRREHAG